MPWVKLGERLHAAWSRIIRRLRRMRRHPVEVDNYIGFGRMDYLYLTGRVMRRRSLLFDERNNLLRNLRNTMNRFSGREIPGIEVTINWVGKPYRTLTDAEGYFHVDQAFPATQAPQQIDDHWCLANIAIPSIPGDPELDHTSIAKVLVPEKGATFGIISDIDDTVLKTDVNSLLKLRAMWHTFLKNAHSRTAFSDVTKFYQALHKAPEGEVLNPVFYISNSPWNIYDLLTDFLRLNQLPSGPVLLRDYGLPYAGRPVPFSDHKEAILRKILTTYPYLPFVLVGDSGEKDADLYIAAARAFPGQIRQIYIRDVRRKRRSKRVQKLIAENQDVPLLLIENYQQALEHAKGLFLLS